MLTPSLKKLGALAETQPPPGISSRNLTGRGFLGIPEEVQPLPQRIPSPGGWAPPASTLRGNANDVTPIIPSHSGTPDAATTAEPSEHRGQNKTKQHPSAAGAFETGFRHCCQGEYHGGADSWALGLAEVAERQRFGLPMPKEKVQPAGSVPGKCFK